MEEQAEVEAEQRYVDDSYECLDRMREYAAGLLDRKKIPDTVDDEILRWHLQERVASLADSAAPLVFGRIDALTEDPLYVGRRHVRDPDGDVKVVDWRARAAAPFYRATIRDPMDVHRRRRFAMEGRRLLDVFDEYLDDPDSVIETSHGGVPDPLLAEIGRARTGQMRDIVATIQAEQDEIIRSPIEELVLVQGGPGTGKTAVGLHRTAFLLYEHRATLERERVLIVGPNRLFLSYISNVLPSLGETAVYQTTVLGLATGMQKVRRADHPAAARLKGDLRMAEVLRRACWSQVVAAEAPIRAHVRGVFVDLPADDVNEALLEAMRARSYREGRRLFHELVGQRILAERELDVYALGLEAPEFLDEALRRSPLERALRALWPNAGHEAIVRRVLTNKAALAAAAEGILSPDEQVLIRQHSQRELRELGWSTADVPLLDECDPLVNGPPARFGHAVVDEAQDLSAMELRMVARRTRTASMTVLGDLAQATAAGAQGSWDAVLDAFGRPANATLRELTIGYRVPSEIMDFANRLLPLAAPGTRASTSVRSSNEPPRLVPSAGDRVAGAVEEARALAELWQSVGLICPEALVEPARAALVRAGVRFGTWEQGLMEEAVILLPPLAAKGLEFDAVVVVEPALLMLEDQGPRRLYVALTRAVQHLSIVHDAPLPDVLAGAPA